VTQREQILTALKSGPVCGTTLLALRMPRYAARVAELRNDGYPIRTRRCQNKYHQHTTTQYEYVLYQDLYEGASL